MGSETPQADRGRGPVDASKEERHGEDHADDRAEDVPRGGGPACKVESASARQEDTLLTKLGYGKI